MNMSKEHLSHCNYGMLTLLLGICTLVLLHIGRRPIICDIEFQNCSFIVIGILCCFFALGFAPFICFMLVFGLWMFASTNSTILLWRMTLELLSVSIFRLFVYLFGVCESWILVTFLCKKLSALWYFIDLAPVVTFGSLGLTEIRYPFRCSTCQKHVCWL